MNITNFDYALPAEFIAQSPAEPRDSARLLVMDRQTGGLTHRHFRQVGSYLRPGDLLVMNDTRVIPGRIKARKITGGAVEILLLRRAAPLTWEVLIGGKAVRLGSKLEVEGRPGLSAVVMQEFEDARRIVQFSEPITPLMESVGSVPLPPYIHEPLADPERYQTVYAKTRGSAAAPTAGLHFTPELLDGLRDRGVEIVTLTLHIGLGTFQPVLSDDIGAHRMEVEHATITPEAAGAINARRGRLVAVGTSAVRALETAATPDGRVTEWSGWTDLFITPGYAFRAVQALVTNFHLPRTTLLMLVSAFAGRDLVLRAYDEAIRERYRVYSFGDAMLVL
jgi:S-adenosylmethionine:tRNA ribosyltransferase-isomerase